MRCELNNEIITVLSDKNEIFTEIGNTDKNINFLNDWYFLNKYSETNKYKDAFKVVYC